MKTAILLGGDASTISGYRDDELKIASVPNNVLWLEGDIRCFNTETFSIFDRNNNTWLNSYDTTIESKVENSFITASNGVEHTPYDCSADILNDWTFVFAGKMITKAITQITLAPRLSKNEAFPLRIGWNAEFRLTLWGGSSSVFRIYISNEDITNALSTNPHFLICATFSVERGLSLWFNGVRVAEKKEDKNKLTSNTFLIPSNRNCGIGHMLIYKEDLTKNVGNLELINDTLLKYYNIPKLT